MIIVRIDRNQRYTYEFEISLDTALIGLIRMHIRDNQLAHDIDVSLNPLEAKIIGMALLDYADDLED